MQKRGRALGRLTFIGDSDPQCTSIGQRRRGTLSWPLIGPAKWRGQRQALKKPTVASNMATQSQSNRLAPRRQTPQPSQFEPQNGRLVHESIRYRSTRPHNQPQRLRRHIHVAI